MKPLFVTGIVTFSGKTALTLGIALKLKEKGQKVGYFKPISTQPFMQAGKLVDEDAAFVQRSLGLETPAHDLSSVIIDEALFERLMRGEEKRDFAADVRADFEKLSKDKDVLLVEGGASMREGYAVGLSTVSIAKQFNLPTLGVVRYRNGLLLIDDILALRHRIPDHLLGVVINSVPADAMDQIKNEMVPYLERQGVKVYGVLPYQQNLMALTVGEIKDVLKAKELTGVDRSDQLIENLHVGAMSAESALPRFRRSLNKAVITGGDRADIQAVALETSTTALVLTGNLMPSSTVVKRAEELGVSVLLVPGNTMETVEAVERVFGKTRLNQPEKLDRYRQLLDANFDWARLFADMGV